MNKKSFLKHVNDRGLDAYINLDHVRFIVRDIHDNRTLRFYFDNNDYFEAKHKSLEDADMILQEIWGES